MPYFFRTEDGAEIDLVFERGGRLELAIEIKRTTSPDVSKGFVLGCRALRARDAYVVHGGTEEWPMRDGVTAISLVSLMKRLDAR
jgi:predicted AAA+ superfamily ATPase